MLITLLLMPVSKAGNKNDAYNFDELDRCLSERQKYVDAKETKIHNLSKTLFYKQNTTEKQFEIYFSLYKEYQSFQYDSAYSYASKMLRVAEQLNDYNRIGRSKIALSFSCRSRGVYKEAYELLYSIDQNKLNADVLTDLYAYKSSLNIELAIFFGKEPYYSKYYKESLETARTTDKIATHDNIFVKSARIRIYELGKKYPEAIKLATDYLSKSPPDNHDYAMLAADIAGYYIMLGDTANAIKYYTKSSIADIKSATKETTAIRILAEILYKEKDFKRSHNYIVQALDDATYYNADQRKMQISTVFPIIEAEIFDTVKQQKNNLMIYSIAISCLLVSLLLALFVINRQRKRLNSAKVLIEQQNNELLASNNELTKSQKKISKQNSELLQTNDKLKEAQRIKEEYIGYFFTANSVYIEKLEDYRKLVNRKVRNKQMEDLLQISNTSELQQDRENMFALFDQIFLKLFPDFVERFNQLFQPEDRVNLKNTNNSLSAELRIFALIRLGITESERIAKFLDYSVHTVNNYKTKVKNRSIVPNELFEQKIMQIESIETIIDPEK